MEITTTKKSTQRVLIAQSDPDLADLMREVIEGMGYGVDVAESGFGVLGRLRGHQYFLLITELHLPIMDGVEMAEAIRDGEGPGERLPIVAMTSYSKGAARVEFLAAGIDDFLELTLNINELEETVRTWGD